MVSVMQKTFLNNLSFENFLSDYIDNIHESNKIKRTLRNEILTRIKNDGDRLKWIYAKINNSNWSDSNKNLYNEIIKNINSYDATFLKSIEMTFTSVDKLKIDNFYTRKEISIFSNNYNEQRGILVEKRLENNSDIPFHPNVFAIINSKDDKNKYQDYIKNELIYYYPLDFGSNFPMNDNANVAIKNILANNDCGIFMFSKEEADRYKFLGKYYMYKLSEDENGKLLFILKPFVNLRSEKEIKLSLISVWENEDKWISKNKILDKDDTLVLTKNRVNQGYYREIIMNRFKSRCILTGIENEELLIASHIKPYAKCNKNEKVDKNNGLLLSALADKLFDKGLISFDKNANIIFSNKIDSADLIKIKKHLLNTNLYDVYFSSKKYFEFHYANVFKWV